jgi:hypothetical protein
MRAPEPVAFDGTGVPRQRDLGRSRSVFSCDLEILHCCKRVELKEFFGAYLAVTVHFRLC